MLLVNSLTVLLSIIPLCQAASPIVIFPGLSGNRIEAKLNKTHTVHYLCTKHSDWTLIWVRASEFLPEVVDCWADNMKMLFSNGTFYNNSGVQIRAPGFGNTTTVEILDPSLETITGYFSTFVSHFANLGYKRGINITAVPYDWRQSPDTLDKQGYYIKVKGLIEKMYNTSGGQKVTIVAHSYGGPISLYFLTQFVTQDWKDKFIFTYITLTAPWQGMANFQRIIASGDNVGIFIVNPLTLREMERSQPSSHFMLPVLGEVWPQDHPIIITPKQNYSAYNIKEFYESLNFSKGFEMYMSVSKFLKGLPPPRVPTYCYYGSGINTPAQFYYSGNSYPNHVDKILYEDGDYTVTSRNLVACKQWKDKQSEYFYSQEMPKVGHRAFVSNIKVIQAVQKIVLSEFPPKMATEQDTRKTY